MSATLPPFPSQDLAKLVLGYLAEEQLMTAYDEFLQGSPYLDAHRNEYDRIFMTSLKNILAEYRAVKIYVETCKPFVLRKQLLQCTNLLEIVIYLIKNTDITKINAQDKSTQKQCTEKQSAIVNSQSIHSGCEVCGSLQLPGCLCKQRQSNIINTNVQIMNNSLENSVETTSLADLPGNQVCVKKKQVKVQAKDKMTSLQASNSSSMSHGIESIQSSNNYIVNEKEPHLVEHQVTNKNPSTSSNSTVKAPDSYEIRSHAETDALNSISASSVNNTSKNIRNTRASIAITFQDFASGVQNNDKVNYKVLPDSSSLESLPEQDSERDEGKAIPGNLLLNTRPSADATVTNTTVTNAPDINTQKTRKITSKANIKIISDVKVDNAVENKEVGHKKVYPVIAPNNATSTPLFHMKTIVINGTPAYNSSTKDKQTYYTKDEIMAMPTLIVVPTSGAAKHLVNNENQTVKQINTKTDSNLLSPLIVDISNPYLTNLQSTSVPRPKKKSKKMNNKKVSDNLLQTIDLTKSSTDVSALEPSQDNSVKLVNSNTTSVHTSNLDTCVNSINIKTTSVPKDNVASFSGETNSTPQVPPNLRKSSSTPRRSSHIRVLDFATPKSILHNVVLECVETNNSDPKEVPSESSHVVPEIVNVRSSSINLLQNNSIDNKNENDRALKKYVDKSNKDNTIVINKNNWDADLRAAALLNQNETFNYKSIPSTKTSRKKNISNKNKKVAENSKNEKKIKEKKKPSRDVKPEDNESTKIKDDIIHVPLKPTINIISANNWTPTSVQDNCKKVELNVNQFPNEIEEEVAEDTPETERLLLQNVIGPKLNISDFLETPYKQAIYDIQMDTPKFLGPELPGDPMSDIKIMNIPTPRFFDTPKLTITTPSSYSSRPTDYSSGGSYYKPDDQDFMPIPDLRTSIPSPSHDLKGDSPQENNSLKSSRPVRKCAKNVSYYNNSIVNNSKTKDVNTENNTACVKSASSNVPSKKEKNIKISKEIKSSDIVKANNVTNRKRSPIKKPKQFVKTKRNRLTPTKDSSRIKISRHISPKYQNKKTISKSKITNKILVTALAPTKSRRKSSTPRKIHCAKTFNSESSGHDSPDIATKLKNNVKNSSTNDSDTEHIALRWSDDGSQDDKLKERQRPSSINESEDISKIKKYIESCTSDQSLDNIYQASLHANLVKRGFDAETAKIIERDLLDTSPLHESIESLPKESPVALIVLENEPVDQCDSVSDKNVKASTDEEESEEIELSVKECSEESTNFFSYSYDDCKSKVNNQIIFKDKYCMEVCIEDGIVVRLRATSFNSLFEQVPIDTEDINEESQGNSLSTEESSVHTPLKDTIKAQCYEIFDSTLTSIDTPLKVITPKKKGEEVAVMEITLEEERFDNDPITESNDDKENTKRKRCHSGNAADDSESKKAKTDPQYLLNSASIQNFDIESLLTKLHGP